MPGAHAASQRPRVAVILAAGNGSRLHGHAPKPLMRVHGTRLIERAILGLARAGVERFVVVTGAYRDQLAIVPALPRLRGCAIELVHCADWELGNGHSLACGAAAAGAPFLLAMADHVFDPEIAVRLGEAAAAAPEIVHLATDADLPGVFDLEDATKVRTAGAQIVEIGKQLTAFDRVDVGLFACPASLAAVAAEIVAAGASGVSDVMRTLIARGGLRSVPVDGLLWQDVDTPAMRREAERRLLASTRKSTDGPIARVINRPLSLAATGVLARFDLRPNAMTTLVFALGLVAALLIARATPGALVGAAILIQLASVLDGCDGELARVNLRGTRFGAWYDTITDNIRFTVMVAACAVAAYRLGGSGAYLVSGVAFVAAAIYLVATMVAYLRRHGASGTHLVVVARVDDARAHDRSWLTRALYRVRVLAKQDVLAFGAAIALAAQLPQVVLVVGLLVVASMIIVVDRALAHDGVRPGGLRLLLGLAGVGLLGWLLSMAPLGEIAQAIRAMGWGVLLAIPIVLGWTLVNSLGLRALLAGRVLLPTLLTNRIVGDGYNAIVPAAGIGGEPLRIAMLGEHLPTMDAAVAVVVDRLISLVAGLLASAAAFVIAALAIPLPHELVVGLGAFAAAAIVAAGLVLAIVRGGLSGRVLGVVGRWAGADPIRPIALSGPALAQALGWNVLGRIIAGLEVALYGYLLGLELSLVEVVFVTGVMHAVGTVGFLIPQGIGIAEGAAVYALGLLGHPPELGLAFGLVRRARLLLVAALAVALHLAGRRRGRTTTVSSRRTP